MPIGAIAYRQTATYWGSPVQNGFGGYTFSAPVVVACRWEDTNERYLDNAGEEKVSRSTIWTYERLEEGGYLAQGNHSGVTDPTTLDNAYAIQRSVEIPDLRGLNYERRSYL